jgi:hypothetical protein
MSESQATEQGGGGQSGGGQSGGRSPSEELSFTSQKSPETRERCDGLAGLGGEPVSVLDC